MRRSKTEEYHQTEAGVAERVRDEYLDKIAFNTANKKWYIYSGKVWVPDDSGEIITMILWVVRTIPKEDWSYKIPDNLENEKQQKVWEEKIKVAKKEFANSFESYHRIKAVSQIAASMMSAEFDKHDLIAFNNGVLEPDGTFREHKPDDYITTLIPTDYHEEVPFFKPGADFLKQISCNDPEWVYSLMQILGLCLVHGNPEQVFFVFKGGGGNGKGVLIDWLCRAFGSTVGSVTGREISIKNNDQRQTSLADTISRCRFLVCKEKGGEKLDDELVQAITGEKYVTLKRIQTGTAEYEVVGSLIMITNRLPEFRSGGKPMQRRQIAVPFDLDLPIEKQDSGLLDRLATDEGNEWLVKEIINAMRNYLEKPELFRTSLCDRITIFSKEAILEQDPMQLFINDRLIREVGKKTPGVKVYEEYYKWKYEELQALVDKRERGEFSSLAVKNKEEVKELYQGLKEHGIHIEPRCRVADENNRVFKNVLVDWRVRDDDKDGYFCEKVQQKLIS